MNDEKKQEEKILEELDQELQTLLPTVDDKLKVIIHPDGCINIVRPFLPQSGDNIPECSTRCPDGYGYCDPGSCSNDDYGPDCEDDCSNDTDVLSCGSPCENDADIPMCDGCNSNAGEVCSGCSGDIE